MRFWWMEKADMDTQVEKNVSSLLEENSMNIKIYKFINS